MTEKKTVSFCFLNIDVFVNLCSTEEMLDKVAF